VDWTFYAVAVTAVVILGIGKGGYAGVGMLAMPLMALYLPPIKAASIMLPILIVQDAVSAWAYRRDWDRRNLAILLPGAAVGVGLGYLLAARLQVGVIEAVLGLIAIVFGLRQIALVRGARTPAPKRARALPGLFYCAAAGFTSMIAQSGAPPFQIYTIPQRLPRDTFVGTSVVFFTVVNWMKLPAFLALGEMDRETLTLGIILMPVAVVSTWLGVWLVRRSSGPILYLIIFGLMVVVGVRLLLRGLSSL
jgi:uncharacterized protein